MARSGGCRRGQPPAHLKEDAWTVDARLAAFHEALERIKGRHADTNVAIAQVGFGCIVASEMDASILFVNLL
jgi:hypothetical protein